MSDEYIIEAEGLTKAYKLKAAPSERASGLFKKREAKTAVAEHYAVNAIDLKVKRGETLGIIGRNGAGKSTLLKLLTQVIDPTSGLLKVTGKTHALLQLGTGFHNDMTGRENVSAYLAHLGISGKAAERAIEAVIAFAEIGDYIDQQLKTYSTGMQARLMFASATAANPDLLVIDEVLGVGDAYFQHKSFMRIKEMCETDGTTVLIVSHDIYQAAKVCHRMIWMEDGRIKITGKPIDVIKVYEASIAEQEEGRLRKVLMESLQTSGQGAVAHKIGSAEGQWFFEVLCPDNAPPPANISFSEAKLLRNGEVIGEVNFAAQDDGVLSVCEDLGNWGDPETAENGEPVRVFKNHGSNFHKAVFRIDWDEYKGAIDPADDVELQLIATTLISVDMIAALSENGVEPYLLNKFSLTANASEKVTVPLLVSERVSLSQLRAQSALPQSGKRHGSGKVTVTGLQFLDADGNASMQLRHGHPATIEVPYTINDPNLKEKVQVLVVFHRNGIDDIMRIITRDLEFDAKENPNGTIKMRMDPVALGVGAYTFTIMIATNGYFDKDQTLFYSINPDVYDMWPKMAEFTVKGSTLVEQGTGVVGNAIWNLS